MAKNDDLFGYGVVSKSVLDFSGIIILINYSRPYGEFPIPFVIFLDFYQGVITQSSYDISNFISFVPCVPASFHPAFR